ncbi:hypothetical protein E2C01_030178 [Portunus trituberculatus]|uniref:Uncharacterized protein n=1 Tax=Portunus trituberculatus TaxID=210409 RepID=A0A5B7EPS2_PORTR|nr:hypothetical protein [Portunus trituberculatus]
MGEEEEEDVEGEKDDDLEEEAAANHRCVFTSRDLNKGRIGSGHSAHHHHYRHHHRHPSVSHAISSSHQQHGRDTRGDTRYLECKSNSQIACEAVWAGIS